MSNLSKLEETISRLNEARDQARDATRDAHAAKKDLDKTLREVQQLLSQGNISKVVDETVTECTKKYLDSMEKGTASAIQDGYKKVSEQIDILINLALGPVGHMKKDLRPELARRMRLWIDAIMLENAQ